MVYIEVEIHDLYYMLGKENTNIDIWGLFFHIWNWNIKSTDPYTTEIRKNSTPYKKRKIKTTKIFNKRMGYYFVCPCTISWLECIVSPDPCSLVVKIQRWKRSLLGPALQNFMSMKISEMRTPNQQSFLSLIRSHLFVFDVISFALGDWSKKYCHNLYLRRFCLCSLSKFCGVMSSI